MNDNTTSTRRDSANGGGESYSEIFYSDENIVIIDAVGEHMAHELPARASETFLILGCVSGSMTLRLAQGDMTIRENDVVVIGMTRRIAVIETDKAFRGFGLGVRGQLMQAIVHRGRDIQTVLLKLYDNPVIHLSPPALDVMARYNALVRAKAMHTGRRFMRETITYIICAIIYEMFADISLSAAGDTCPPKTGQREVLFKRFARILSEETVPPRRLSYYAARLCITPKYLSVICKQVTGKTAMAWINEYIVSKLRYHLEYTDLTVKEIANKYQFPSLSFFGKYVRRHLGCSPTEYRRVFSSAKTDAPPSPLPRTAAGAGGQDAPHRSRRDDDAPHTDT
ncbi:MAG: helix-turn-helix domain-containing protein [Prevotella sp.]